MAPTNIKRSMEVRKIPKNWKKILLYSYIRKMVKQTTITTDQSDQLECWLFAIEFCIYWASYANNGQYLHIKKHWKESKNWKRIILNLSKVYTKT